MYNENIRKIAPSKSMTIMAKAKRMKAADPEIVDLAGGEPDFETPAKIVAGMIRYASNGYTHYTVGPGLPELRERIARKLREENDCQYWADNIVVTPGGKYAVYLTAACVLNAGDKAMYLNPGWVSYPSIIGAVGGVPIGVNLPYETDYRITRELLENAWEEGTKLLIINYPNNPNSEHGAQTGLLLARMRRALPALLTIFRLVV